MPVFWLILLSLVLQNCINQHVPIFDALLHGNLLHIYDWDSEFGWVPQKTHAHMCCRDALPPKQYTVVKSVGSATIMATTKTQRSSRWLLFLYCVGNSRTYCNLFEDHASVSSRIYQGAGKIIFKVQFYTLVTEDPWDLHFQKVVLLCDLGQKRHCSFNFTAWGQAIA